MSGTPDVSPPPEGVNSSLNKDQPASSSSSTTAASSSGASAVVVAPPTSGAAVSSDQTEAAADENAMSDAPTVTATYTIKVSGSAPLSVGAPATCVKVIDLKNLIAEKDQRFPVAVQKLVFKGTPTSLSTELLLRFYPSVCQSACASTTPDFIHFNFLFCISIAT